MLNKTLKFNALVLSLILFSGCSNFQWNLGRNAPGVEIERPKKTYPQPKEDKKIEKTQEEENKQSFHISTIIDIWGEPNQTKVGNNNHKIYIWKNCKTNKTEFQTCDADGCKDADEQICCDRALETDLEGYVLNLNEAVANCM